MFWIAICSGSNFPVSWSLGLLNTLFICGDMILFHVIYVSHVCGDMTFFFWLILFLLFTSEMISSRQWARAATKGIEQELAILDCYARRPFISAQAQIFLWADRWAFWIRYSSVVTWLLLFCVQFLSCCAVHCLGCAEQLRLCYRLQTSSHTACHCQAVRLSPNQWIAFKALYLKSLRVQLKIIKFESCFGALICTRI